jgi:MtN3 and saliva related transmembrane protein
LTFETEIVGFVAGTLTTLCWAPQAVKIIVSRDGRSISLITQVVFITGCAFWLFYGVLLGSIAIILFNTITIALNVLIVLLKLRFDSEIGADRDPHSRRI